MNKQIILTIIITALVIVGGYFAWQYEVYRNETAFQTGYTQGLFYTWKTGNVAVINNQTPQEVTLNQLCNNLNNQEVK